MKVIEDIKVNGFSHILVDFWQSKVEKILELVLLPLFIWRPLKNIIVIESHNDFDCNGGAFYDYLIREGYNKKYKIVWLVRKKYSKKFPKNVTTAPLLGPNFRKAYYACNAKYFVYDCQGISKLRKGQTQVYCSHGAGGLKRVKGVMTISDKFDYVLAQSERYAPIQADQWSMEYPNDRIVSIGYPSHDVLIGNREDEIKKITNRQFKKYILWMPTFRKNSQSQRNDSMVEQKMGVPLFQSESEVEGINDFLKKQNSLLILKIHPKQDLTNLRVKNMSNIVVLTGDDVKKLDVDNYRLMNCVDALISDYSGAAFDFLQLNRPIGYVLDDMEEYKLGFVVDDIHTLIAGKEIYNLEDFRDFLDDVIKGKDQFKKKREEIRDFIYEYHDSNSSERLANLLGLKK